MKKIATILSFANVLWFFVPVFRSDAYIDKNVSISICKFVFGGQKSDLYFHGSFGYIIILLISIAIALLLNYFNKNKKIVYVGSAILSVIDLILVGTCFGAAQKVNLLRTNICGYLYYAILVALVACCIVFLVKGNMELKDVKNTLKNVNKETIVNSVNKSVERVNDVLNKSSQKKSCPNCNAELDRDATFCPKCGTKYVEPQKKVCSKCGAIMKDEDEFCVKCGTKYEELVTNICNKCGTSNEPDAMFCEKCGNKLTSDEMQE